MPLYEYQCEKCAKRFERIQKYSDPPIETCPSCGAPVKKLFSSPAIQFKGSGFYITDYPKKSAGESSSAKSDGSSSSEGKSSSKGDSGSKGDGASTGDSASKGDSSSKDRSSSTTSSSTTDSTTKKDQS